MTILAGIDEAGYGPLLGPMVASACIFSVPQDLLKSDLWQVLSKAVSRQKQKLGGRLLINDSKKVYSANAGLKHLHRTLVASIAAAVGRPAVPKTVGELLSILCPDSVPQLQDYPWYNGILPAALPLDEDVAVPSCVFAKTAAENQIQFLGFRSRFLEVAHYNRRIEQVKNKARVLFIEICSLIQTIFDTCCDNDGAIQILIDRQGGRTAYAPELMRAFPDAQLTILTESEKLSSYQLQFGQRCIRLHFVIGGDDKFLPIALASMSAKYIRELLMLHWNQYFAQLYPNIKPTAGYWQDGQRFIQDIKIAGGNLEKDHSKLIRYK